jgi:hypothetical protein
MLELKGGRPVAIELPKEILLQNADLYQLLPKAIKE